MIKSLLDTDLYKFTTMQYAFLNFPKHDVKFEFVCRNKEVDLTPYTEEIKESLRAIETLSFSEEELSYLSLIKDGIFKKEFIDYLKDFRMNYSQLEFSTKNGLEIRAKGLWHEVTLWEIYVLSVVNEIYFKRTQLSGSKEANDKVMLSGYERLTSTIMEIKQDNHNKKEGNQLKIVEFGTRRRFSSEWQARVLSALAHDVSENLLGTSNVKLAVDLDLEPMGTFPHECLSHHQIVDYDPSNPMKSYIESQQKFLRSWYEMYGDKLAIALSDIFGTDAFLLSLDKDLKNKYRGYRQDSGDAVEWANKVIADYKKEGIDPSTKVAMFSDSLDIKRCKEIRDQVSEMKIMFGIGTFLTNNFNFKALNIVMKMTEANNLDVVKISDQPSKAIGNKEIISNIQKYFNELKKET